MYYYRATFTGQTKTGVIGKPGVKIPDFKFEFTSEVNINRNNIGRYTVKGQQALIQEVLTRFNSTPVEPVLLNVTDKLRNTTATSMKQWQTAKDDGSIMTNPMFVYSGSIQDRKITNEVHVNHTAQQSVSADILYHQQGGNYGELIDYWDGILLPNDANNNPTMGSLIIEQLSSSVTTSVFTKYGTPDIRKIMFSIFGLVEFPPELHNEAIAEVRSGAFDLATEILEFRETKKFVLNTLNNVRRVYRSARSGQLVGEVWKQTKRGKHVSQRSFVPKDKRAAFADAISGADKLAANHMAFRYAVTPLIHSINDAAKVITKGIPQFLTSRKRRDVTVEFELGPYSIEADVQARVWAKARINPKPKHKGMALNVPAALWEVTPGAFVADWVFPVGDFLMAAIPPDWEDELRVMRTIKINSVKITVQTEHGPLTVHNDLSGYRALRAQPDVCFNLRPKPSITAKRGLDSLALAWFSTRARF